MADTIPLGIPNRSFKRPLLIGLEVLQEGLNGLPHFLPFAEGDALFPRYDIFQCFIAIAGGLIETDNLKHRKGSVNIHRAGSQMLGHLMDRGSRVPAFLASSSAG